MASSVSKKLKKRKGNDNNYEAPDFRSCKTVKHGKKRLKTTVTSYCQMNHHTCAMLNNQTVDHRKKYRDKYDNKNYLNDQLQEWGKKSTLENITGIDFNDSNIFSFLIEVAQKKNDIIQKALIDDGKWCHKRKEWINNIIKIYHEEYESEGKVLYDNGNSINQTVCLAITLFDILVHIYQQCTCTNSSSWWGGDCLTHAELSQIALVMAIKYETLEDEPQYDEVRRINNFHKSGNKLAIAELQCFAKLNYNVFYPTTMHFLNYFFGMGVFFSDDVVHYQNGETVEANTIENLPPIRIHQKKRNQVHIPTQQELFNNYRTTCLRLVHTTLLHYEFKNYLPVVVAISILIVARIKLKFLHCWREELNKVTQCDHVKLKCRRCYTTLLDILHSKEEREKIMKVVNL